MFCGKGILRLTQHDLENGTYDGFFKDGLIIKGTFKSGLFQYEGDFHEGICENGKLTYLYHFGRYCPERLAETKAELDDHIRKRFLDLNKFHYVGDYCIGSFGDNSYACGNGKFVSEHQGITINGTFKNGYLDGFCKVEYNNSRYSPYGGGLKKFSGTFVQGLPNGEFQLSVCIKALFGKKKIIEVKQLYQNGITVKEDKLHKYMTIDFD